MAESSGAVRGRHMHCTSAGDSLLRDWNTVTALCLNHSPFCSWKALLFPTRTEVKHRSQTTELQEKGISWPKTGQSFKPPTTRQQRCFGSGDWAQLPASPQILPHRRGQRRTADRTGTEIPSLPDVSGRLVRPSDNVTSRITSTVT